MNLELYVCPVVVDDATSSSNHVTSMLVLTTTLLLVPQLPLGEKHEYLPPMIISVPVMNYHESIPNNCRPNTAAMFRLKYYWSSKQPKTIIDLKETSSSESNRLTACRARNRCSWPPSEVPPWFCTSWCVWNLICTLMGVGMNFFQEKWWTFGGNSPSLLRKLINTSYFREFPWICAIPFVRLPSGHRAKQNIYCLKKIIVYE